MYAMMVSLPLGYFMYSAWMSGWGRLVEAGGGWQRYDTRSRPLASPTTPPRTSTALFPITHPPDPIACVIRDQQGAVRRDDEPDGTPPARAVGQLPAGDEVQGGGRPAALHADAHDLRARRHAAVPGAVVRHERVALILGGELRPHIKREAERGRVRLHGQRRGLDAGAVRVGKNVGIRLPGQVTLRPTVPLSVLQDVQVLRRNVVPKIVAVVVVGPELASAGVERESHRVAEPPCEDSSPRAVKVEAGDGRAHRVARCLDAHVARGSSRHVQQIVGPERECPRAVTAGGQTGDDGHRSAGAGIESLDRRLRGEVERIPAERDPRRIAQIRQDRNHRFRGAVAVRVHQPDDLSGSRLGRVDRAARTEREEAHTARARREDVDGESDGDVQHVTSDRDRVHAARRRGGRGRGRGRILERGALLAGQAQEREQYGPSHTYLLTDGCARSRPSGSTRRSAGATDTPKVTCVSRPATAIVRRSVAPPSPRISTATCGRRNTPHAAGWVCETVSATRCDAPS